MAKIWEIEFIQTSGTSPKYYLDNIGTQHITNVSGTSVLPTPVLLPGFTTRSGIAFPSADGTNTALGLTNITNAHLCNPYSGTLQRSLELWFYLPEALVAGAVSQWDGDGTIWTEGGSGGYSVIRRDGTTVDLEIYLGSGRQGLNGVLNHAGWKHLVVTSNRILNRGRVYFNGIYWGTIPDTPAFSPVSPYIGDALATTEAYFMLGKVATYNAELTGTEVTDLYNSFLLDRNIDTTIYNTISGTIYGLDGTVASGHSVYLIYNTKNLVVSSGVTTESGTYSLTVPHAGNYILVSSPVGTSGGSACNIVVTSEGVYYP